MRFSAVFWVGTIAIAAIASAQQPATPAPQAPKPAAPISSLKLLVLQGRDAVNDIQGRTFTIPIIELRDDNDQPVEGAQVIFSLPANGPGGFFPGNTITFTTRTNAQGQASAPFTPNGVPGRFTIQVTATSIDRIGQVSIPQSNGTVEVGAPRRRWFQPTWKKSLILAGVTAGAVILAVELTRSSPTVVVSAGPPVFGGPH